MRKVCVATTSRAEYGLLKNLLEKIQNDQELELQLIISGTHLNKEFGNTYAEIENDFPKNYKIEMDLTSDTKLNISKSMGKLQQDISELLIKIKPDIVVLLGDRYEIFTIATSAMMLNIPLAHMHGGETTQGAIDEAIRHSITKMSHLHFCATEKYRSRILQLGENPKNVFNFGTPGIENINCLKLLTKHQLEKQLNFTFAKKNLLVTFHPETLSHTSSKEQFLELLHAINKLSDTNIIFTKTNADSDGKIINLMIDEYVLKHDNCIAFKSMGQLNFLSTLQYIDAIVGNSSSGIIEAPSFKIATINIGNRQKGREKAKSVIDVSINSQMIFEAIQKIYSKEFQHTLNHVNNPYKSDETSQKILDTIKKVSLKNILQKKFFDYEQPLPQ